MELTDISKTAWGKRTGICNLELALVLLCIIVVNINSIFLVKVTLLQTIDAVIIGIVTELEDRRRFVDATPRLNIHVTWLAGARRPVTIDDCADLVFLFTFWKTSTGINNRLRTTTIEIVTNSFSCGSNAIILDHGSWLDVRLFAFPPTSHHARRAATFVTRNLNGRVRSDASGR